MTTADAVCELFASSEAELLEANRQLVDLIADLAFENARLERLYERELIARIHGDVTIDRLQRILYRPRAA